MSDLSIFQTLRREIIRSKKKSLLLGLLLIVGLAVWIPQISRALRSPGQFAVAPVSQVSALETAIPAETPKSLSTPEFLSWDRLAEAIDQGEFLRPFAPTDQMRSPFAHPILEPQVIVVPVINPEPPVVEAPLPPPVQKELLPAPTQLVLKSTMQGRKSRGAVINDKYYRVGDILKSDETSYFISQVEARRVILKSGERYFELLIPSVLPRTEYSFPPTSPSPSENSL